MKPQTTGQLGALVKNIIHPQSVLRGSKRRQAGVDAAAVAFLMVASIMIFLLDRLRVRTKRLDFTHGLLLARGCTDGRMKVGLRLIA